MQLVSVSTTAGTYLYIHTHIYIYIRVCVYIYTYIYLRRLFSWVGWSLYRTISHRGRNKLDLFSMHFDERFDVVVVIFVCC